LAEKAKRGTVVRGLRAELKNLLASIETMIDNYELRPLKRAFFQTIPKQPSTSLNKQNQNISLPALILVSNSYV
jgi:hypothetical protein